MGTPLEKQSILEREKYGREWLIESDASRVIQRLKAKVSLECTAKPGEQNLR